MAQTVPQAVIRERIREAARRAGIEEQLETAITEGEVGLPPSWPGDPVTGQHLEHSSVTFWNTWTSATLAAGTALSISRLTLSRPAMSGLAAGLAEAVRTLGNC